VAYNPERNAPRKGSKNGPRQGGPSRFSRRPDSVSDDWLWGWHAVSAALANPRREPAQRLLATESRAKELEQRFGRTPGLEVVEPGFISHNLPGGAVHQGLALRIPLLDSVALADFAAGPGKVLLMLDQVTDPQNVGAILRSAAAFGAAGLILQDRHAPQLVGALAKAAAGAVDAIPTARITNLSRALEELAELGWRAVGLDGTAERALEQVLDGSPTVLVLGSEGEGLRRLVAEHCDELAKIPMPGGFESLNVGAAAAVALYEASRSRG
jgi:23S rRNA (guanosine2251-2'-O)-methyltransferase